jgi:hypothetical protein
MKASASSYLLLVILGCAIFQAVGIEDPLLLIKIPTRSRPAQFFFMLNLYYEKLSKKVRYHFLITCDVDDQKMNNEKVIAKLKKYPNLTYNFSRNFTKIEAYNKDMELAPKWDIVLVTSDDMQPLLHGYDKLIVDTMEKYFPNYDGVLNFNDGHVTAELNSLPIIGKNYYNLFGYIYHPSYVSLFCDAELTIVSRTLNKEVIRNEVIIRHNHPHWQTAKWDALYEKNQTFSTKDEQNFNQRLAHNFYMDQLKK